MRKISHILDANAHHHAKTILENTYRNFHQNHNHLFLIKDFKLHKSKFKDVIQCYPDIKIIELVDTNQFTQIVKESDLTIIHSFIVEKYWLKILILHRDLTKKIVWVCWGAGISKKIGVRGTLENLIRRYIFNKIKLIVTLLKPDALQLKENFGVKSVITLPYYSATMNFGKGSLYKAPKSPFTETKSRLNIKVSNNASIENNHLKSFKSLSKFANENIKVIAPLSYSKKSNEYTEEVIKKGKDYFLNKFEPLTQFLLKEDYIDFLSSNVDILVYDAERQMGLFNLYVCLYYGKKIYCRGYNYEWLDYLGFRIWNSDEINHLSFESFSAPLTIAENENNLRILNEKLHLSILIKNWLFLFNGHIEEISIIG